MILKTKTQNQTSYEEAFTLPVPKLLGTAFC